MAELNYRYNNEIDLERDSLFKYVLELDELEKTMNEVGPSDPNNFGKPETFKDSGKKWSKSTMFIWVVVILVIIAVVIYSSCGGNTKNNTMSYSSDLYAPNFGNRYDSMQRMDFLSPEIGPDVRMVFRR